MQKKVLIIDDDLDVCKEIKYALQNETTDAYYATSARDAVEKLTTLPFCLVIMDTRLSETDGLSLLRTIRNLKTIPVLVLSSKVESTDKVVALRAGASSVKWYNIVVTQMDVRYNIFSRSLRTRFAMT